MARQETQLKAVLTLVDRVSPALKGLKKEMRIASREMQKGISQIGDVAKTAGAAIVALAAAGGTTWAATVAAADASVALDSFSKQIGINVERLQAWQNVAVSTGMEADEFSEALRDMNIELSDAATGGKDELAQLLRRVGISARDSSGNIRNANDVFLEFADAIARQTDPMIQYRMAILAFGEDTGARILPILRQGSEAFRESEEAMRAAGSAITDRQISRLKDFRNQWGLVKQSFSAFSISVLSALSPSLSKLAQGFQRTLNEIRPLINAHIERWAEQLSQAMGKIPWDSVIGKIDALISGGDKLKKEFGVVGETLSFVFENLGTIATVYLGSKALMAVVSFGQALVSLGKGISMFIRVALPLVGAASPFILLATVVAGAAMAIIDKWDRIKTVVMPIIQGIGDAIKWLISLITDAAQWIDNKIQALIPDFLKKGTDIRVAFDNATQNVGTDEQTIPQSIDSRQEFSSSVEQTIPQSIDSRQGFSASVKQTPSQSFYSTQDFSIPSTQSPQAFMPSVIENRMSGRVDVTFNNAPAGLSIERTSGSNGVAVDARVNRADTGRGPYAPTFAFAGGDA